MMLMVLMIDELRNRNRKMTRRRIKLGGGSLKP